MDEMGSIGQFEPKPICTMTSSSHFLASKWRVGRWLFYLSVRDDAYSAASPLPARPSRQAPDSHGYENFGELGNKLGIVVRYEYKTLTHGFRTR